MRLPGATKVGAEPILSSSRRFGISAIAHALNQTLNMLPQRRGIRRSRNKQL
jgi:hypothetical protein